MAQFYTLEQASEILRLSQDKLREMARSNKLRSFQDKKTLRFRAQDIEEMARTLGLGSSDASVPVKKADLNDPDAPIPISADEDLLGSSDFEIGGGKSSSNLPAGPATDSGVKLIPDSHDQILPIPTPGDTNAGLLGDEIGLLDENASSPAGQQPGMMNLDLDAMKPEPSRSKPAPKKKPTGKAGSQLPSSSPFELSETDIDLSFDMPNPGKKKETLTGSTSDISLAPESDSEFDLDLGSEQIVLADEDINPGKGKPTPANRAPKEDPADSAISLEMDSSGIMELALDDIDEPESPDGKSEGSSSDFELTLEDSTISKVEEGSSSEFELTLDEGSSEIVLEENQEGSDSEFELSIDDEGDLSAGDSGSADQVDGDLFEDSDFETPSLDSDSESIALNEESSDFEIQLDESSESETEIPDDSEGVDLDEEPAPRPKKKGKATELASAESSGLDIDLDEENAEEYEIEEEDAIQPVATAPAQVPWGIVPTLMLLPSVIVLFLVGLMSFELLQGAFGYQKQTRTSTMILLPIARMLDTNNSLPKE